jgi:hypothetical protein
MIEILLDQITSIKSVRKVFMKKRDVMEYDGSWETISNKLTVYDIDIIANVVVPSEWGKLVTLEHDFGQRFPNLKFNYSLIEHDPQINSNSKDPNAKLIYSADN